MFLFQKCLLKSAVVLAVMILACSAVYSGTINVHWTQNLNNPVLTHGSTVSGVLMINLIEPNDNDPNTTENMAFVDGYIQENSHSVPQVPITNMTGNAICATCSGPNQMVISTTMPIILDHNASYTIHIRGRVTGMRMFPPGPLTPRDVTPTDVVVNSNNLYYTSSTLDVMPWDPSTMSSINFSSAYDDAQTGTCRSTYEIYSTGGSLVYTKQPTQDLARPGSESWSWNGLDSLGYPAPKGLYVMKCSVTANVPTMTTDRNRSDYLEIIRVDYNAEYGGVDDNGTPSDTSDDKYLFYLKSYKLKDTQGLSASEGEIWLYNPSLSKVATYNITTLACQTHSGSTDGLQTNTTGLLHKLLIRVPIGLMQTEGDYRFVAHIKDSHENDYRNHQNRWALELNEIGRVPKLVMLTPPENQTTAYTGETSGTEENRIFYKQFVVGTNPATDGLTVVVHMIDSATAIGSGNGQYTTNNWNITTKRSPKTVYATSLGAYTSNNATIHFKKNRQLIVWAHDFLGHDYVSGTDGPDTFDCSGFQHWLYDNIGITLGDDTAQGYYNGSTKITSKANMLPGDWLFFDLDHIPAQSDKIGHTGVLEEFVGSDFKMIHAANPINGVIETTFSDTDYYSNHNTLANGNRLCGYYYASNERF